MNEDVLPIHDGVFPLGGNVIHKENLRNHTPPRIHCHLSLQILQ